jgi:hypothetical protein
MRGTVIEEKKSPFPAIFVGDQGEAFFTTQSGDGDLIGLCLAVGGSSHLKIGQRKTLSVVEYDRLEGKLIIEQ